MTGVNMGVFRWVKPVEKTRADSLDETWGRKHAGEFWWVKPGGHKQAGVSMLKMH